MDELPALQDIERAAGQCFKDVGMPEIAADDPLSLDELAWFQASEMAWVAVNETDQPMAYLIAKIVDDDFYVEQISVHSAYARRRIGKAMLDHVAGVARDADASHLTLATFRDVPWNAPYYLTCGFEIMSRESLTPGLLAIQRQEIDHGLYRWARVFMRRAV
ncbi:MAG: GNAT family N-acetyltransferase [Corynebacteriales bacterium]|nr:GNAT family N-acetyltransferase [Mycobacteriales bacterium]